MPAHMSTTMSTTFSLVRPTAKALGVSSNLPYRHTYIHPCEHAHIYTRVFTQALCQTHSAPAMAEAGVCVDKATVAVNIAVLDVNQNAKSTHQAAQMVCAVASSCTDGMCRSIKLHRPYVP